MEHVTVYHGTTITNCNSILKDKKFYHSTSSEEIYKSIQSKKNTYQWLGDGIYFWVNNSSFAKYWATKVAKRNNDEPGVIRTSLSYEEERCFDLRKRDERDKVLGFINGLIESSKGNLKISDLDRNEKNKLIGFVCDFLFKKGKMEYDLIFCDFLIEDHPILPKFTSQICVKNDKVIEYHNMEII